MQRPIIFALVLLTCGIALAGGVKIQAPVLEENMPRSASYGVIWETPRSAWMPKCKESPKVDGVLDDPCWKGAALLTGFIAPPNRTSSYVNSVLLCYDDVNLYLGCRLGEPQPKKIKAGVKDDGVVAIWTDDCVEIHLQVDSQLIYVEPYKGKPAWVQFITNSVGAQFSQIVSQRRVGSTRYAPTGWNGQWQAVGRVGKDAWYTEVSIPWDKLQIKPVEGASFKVNVGRNFPNNPQSWNLRAYHNPRMFGTVHFGRGKAGGVELRTSRVDCAGDAWQVAVDMVAAGAHKVKLRAALKRDEQIVATAEGELTQIGAEPTTLSVPFSVKGTGEHTVEVQVLSAANDVLAKGYVKATKKPMLERFCLFRHELFAGEKLIRGYFRLGALPPGRGLKAAFQVLDASGQKTLAQCESERLARIEGMFDVDVPPLQAGDYLLRFRVLGDQGMEFAAKEARIRVKDISPVKKRSFTVHIDEPAGVARRAWPVTFGVPFGEGMLRVSDVDEHLRILGEPGAEIPCQTRVLATWTETRRYARWVLIDAQADLAAGKGANLTVEFGTDVERKPPPDDVLVTESVETGDLEVNTGRLRMVIPAAKPAFLASVMLDGKPMTRPVPEGGLYLKLGDPSVRGNLLPHQHEYDEDRSIKTFLAELCSQDYAVEIEHEGPIRSVIKATGWYGVSEGERLCKYILRLYVYRDKAVIDSCHTLVVTEPELYIDSMGLRLKSAARQARMLFGMDEADPVSLPFFGRSSKLALFQPSAEYFRVSEFLPIQPASTANRFGTQFASGRRAPGWVDISYGTHNLLVGIKDFWQEYPKEISAAVDGIVDLAFVSGKSGEHLDLRSAPFTKSEQFSGDSEGIAKTTRFVLQLHRRDENEDVTASRAKAAMADLAVWVDPAWMQEADPFWRPVTRCTLDSPNPRKRAYANYVDMAVMDQPTRPDVVQGLFRYGILNYGDRMHGQAYRGWYNNEDYEYGFSEWVGYLATGNRRMFDSVRSFSRHLMDVDTLNYTTRKDPGRLGLQSRHRRAHWGQPGIITHSYLDQSLLYYYLLGYERGADHADLIEAGQRVWDWWPGEGWWHRSKNPQGAVARDYGVDMRICMNAYRHCWDPVLFLRAYELWARYKEGFLPSGDHIIGYFNVERPLVLYAHYTKDPEALAIIKRSSVCAGLSAEFGQIDKLENALSSLDATYAGSFRRIPVPAWAVWFNPTGRPSDVLQSVSTIAYAERLVQHGQKLTPRPGPLHFNGDKEILFLEEADQEHKVRVHVIGSSSATHGKVTIVDPRGKMTATPECEIAALPVVQAHTLQMEFTIPADKVTGVYTLRSEGFGAGYRRLRIAEGPERRLFRVNREAFGPGYWWGQKLWFYVPKGCQKFRIGAKPLNRSHRYGFVIFDPEDKPVVSENWYFQTSREAGQIHWAEATVPADKQQKWWSLAYSCRKDMVFIWPDELPAFVAEGPDTGFLPEEHGAK